VSDEPRATRTVRYITGIPRKPLPAGHVVVHNHVRPAHPIGLHGFRVWIAAPPDDPRIGRAYRREDPFNVVRCDCGWAPELPEHYRVRFEDPEKERDYIRWVAERRARR
jgi:hypothetical protein